ncbi:cobalamin adenosyltransferase [Clostridium senegalense]|uniref:Cobalamin adenosyltransferase n=1 Tax=Clostridium senegalense TaxID=1465809 RepID=A0A6M0H0Z9_9CLOT|nr:cobalamin adenosyltransferase [Clostridium senegalense]NEU04435.1 cobalamin adenosyltransferase [Clostridium senegalense]
MMKFITEEYLRDLYRKEPFNTYNLQQGQRLTPGAAQYLSDKRIEINDKALKVKKKVSQNKQTEDKQTESKQTESKQTEIVKQVRNSDLNLKKKLCYKLKSIEAIFLVTGSEILREDIFLAQNIIILGRKISNIRNVVNGKGTLETISCKACSGMNSSNFITELDDCFEITEFHMQLKKSNVILKMHTLRCALQELQFEIVEIYNNDDDLKNKIIENFNSIINSLSQLICSAVGGKECQRKE